MKLYLLSPPATPSRSGPSIASCPSWARARRSPNLALPTLAGDDAPEHEVVLCDETVEPIDFDTDADWVGLTGYIVHRQRMFGSSPRPSAPAARRWWWAGRSRRSARSSSASARTWCSWARAEETWAGFLRDVEAGTPRAEYVTEELPSLERTPVPRFDLLKLDRYRSMPIQFARGCPYTCEFCDIIVIYGRRPRQAHRAGDGRARGAGTPRCP
ncbi:MAG: hypothetical protein IPK07_23625 [Deltaproteobacteria bacterium]|nr:hypothetical protein [Deltaproteobacteria bacterium]